MNVEKNDVDINRLFTWGTVFELTYPGTDEVSMVYMRLVGDEDMNKARVYALRKSREFRNTLRDTSTDDSMALIPPFEDVPYEDLSNMVAMFSTRSLSKKSIRDVSIDLPKQPKDNASLEKQEEYQNKIDLYKGQLEIARMDYVREGIENIKKNISDVSHEDLYKMYVKALTDEFCELKSLAALRDFTTYCGTFSDRDYTKRYFDSIEQFLDLPTHLKEQFVSAYQSLEIGGEELKKSLGATQ